MKKNLLIILLLGFAAFTSAFSQDRKVTGKVISAADGRTLRGVSVKLRGTVKGVITDDDGNFTIAAATGQTLVFSYIGYIDQIVTVKEGNFPAIKLFPRNQLLNEVVVSDGYTSRSKRTRTGSSTTILGVENENKPFSTPVQALQGEIAGLNVTMQSGQPGANVQVRLRGVSSISAGLNPLYVIDGMIINAGDLSRNTTTTNVLAGINENDIESVTVLKDASETALYGSRGANGVIVITTKHGKAGKTQVRFDTEAGSTKAIDPPQAGKPLTADQWKTLFIEGENNAAADFPATYTPARIAADLADAGLPNGRNNDWYRLITRRGRQQQYNVSVTGGNSATRLFASAGYYNQEATTIASSLKRYTGQLNIDHNLSNKIVLDFGINFSNVNQYTPSNAGSNSNPDGGIWFLTPYQLAYNADGTLNSSRIGNTNFTSNYNPLYLAAHDKLFDSQTRILTGLTLKWNILDNLKFSSFGSIDYNVLEENSFSNPVLSDSMPLGSGIDDYSRYFNWLTRNQFDYHLEFLPELRFNAIAGYEAQRSQGYFVTASSEGYPLTQPLLTVSANAATVISGNGTFSNYAFDSFYSLGGFNYRNRYTLTGTFRRDGSSVFGENLRFGNFYSLGAAWNIDEESFFGVQHLFSSAKLRGSYGIVGNAQGIGNYQARATAGYNNNYVGGVGQNYDTVGNPDLTWESQKKSDIGTDFGFMHDRLIFTIDCYYNNIDHLIQSAQLSRTTGFSGITENIGTMYNKGIEGSVKGIAIRQKDFNWTTSFNIAVNQNRVTSLLNHAPITTGAFQIREGMDINTYYVRLYAGVDPANGNALWYTDGSRKATTSSYASAARVNAYHSDPKAFGGFSNSFSYKGFNFNADFYYNVGNMINNASWGFYLNDGTTPISNKYYYDYANRWTTPGQITDVPKYSNAGVNGGQSSSFSTRSLFYGDYIRLKNLVAGYEFKNTGLLHSCGITKLYLYGRGTNLWTKTYDKHLPFDPEQGTSGSANLDVMQAKTFTIGLNVGL